MPVPPLYPAASELPAMSYVDFCHAYWKNGYRYPYPVPRHRDPSPAASYRAFVATRARMGAKDDYVFDRAQNLIRASYEYLAGPGDELVSLEKLLDFLTQPGQQLLLILATYQPVYGWLLKGEQLLEGTIKDDVFCRSRVEGAAEAARGYVLQLPALSTADELRKLHQLLEKGLLTQAEYDAQRAKLLK